MQNPSPFTADKKGYSAREPGEFELRKAEYPDGARLQNGAVARLQARGRCARHFVQTESAGERGRRPFFCQRQEASRNKGEMDTLFRATKYRNTQK